jgi:hypothetical protein
MAMPATMSLLQVTCHFAFKYLAAMPRSRLFCSPFEAPEIALGRNWNRTYLSSPLPLHAHTPSVSRAFS